ncbi:prophage integrase [Aggregatibacter actinomycetemcomitans serotype e str. SC1083]|uniref:Prophage integrase n=2 Tax=Aggregatibacter actinomycetemcomitans TaxID=714 RepID=G4A8E8_AGGAC|nr:integrase arm-type DNA-binding domain-containing protein [Aggregatibacter actinomycetemcomitans]EGY33968.1 prophage integrase [Aggregatibacter actinomycetemcomitans serotype e str. SC1083]KYK75275.1 integrase [Aggregatibacter actinomycetemcomitans serotype e str. SA3096]KYK82769.1 integrase [Aggregatibacter actinomycetemcomitans serotype e str. SC936]TYB21703.1 tyrosine-type recombinase/integrase [Aggregatibacter actinomycetemcomitans]
MSKIVKPLTDTTLKNLKPLDKEYTKSDGKGLYIRVFTHGAKIWYFSYKFLGKHKKISLGSYLDLSLSYAREMAQEYRRLLLRNIDPNIYRSEQNKPPQDVMNFADLARLWRDKRLIQGKFKAETINEAFRRVELHLFPTLASMPITEANLKSFLPTLLPLKNSNTLYKINIALGQIFQLAEDEELIIKNPFRKVHDEFNYIQSKNQPTIKPEELPALFRVLNSANVQKPTALLIEWQLLTILRPAEAVQVEWTDIDWKTKTLHIPAERMKGGKRPHSVPLSTQALHILEQMKQYTFNRKYIFATYSAPYNKPMSTQAANVALKRMGFKGLLIAHGLRSIASTYLHELDIFSSESIELCLSHENRGKVRAAYDKSKKWRSRQEIMQSWGNYVEQCKIEAIKSGYAHS